MNTIPFELDVQMFLRLLIAVVLGALVGYERERAGSRPVYGRTAWSASALFAAVSIHGFGGTGDAALVAAQIGRLICQHVGHDDPLSLNGKEKCSVLSVHGSDCPKRHGRCR